MKKLNKRDIKRFIKLNYNSLDFARHIFYYLREHSELLIKDDYNRLYEELLAFLLEEMRWQNTEENREWMEHLCDLHNKDVRENCDRYRKMQAMSFLEYCKRHWK